MADLINIVVCAEQTEIKVNIKNKIDPEKLEIIGYTEFSDEAKTRILGYSPDVVIFAAESADIDEKFFQFIEDMELASNGCSPVIMTDDVTVSLVNSAARYGVRQVMDLEISGRELTENLEGVLSSERKLSKKINVERKTRSHVYSFFSGKGGVGKTTVSTNLAVNLASRGKKTLLIDLDLQFGDADMALDLNPSETIVDVVRDSLGISIDNLTNCAVTHASGLSVLSSPSSPELAEYVQSNHVKQIIDTARNYYEYIILDCGCNLTDPVITALESSDTIFMVNDVNILSLKRAKLCQNVLLQINQGDKIKLIINKNTKKNNVKIADYESILNMDAYAIFSSDLKTINDSLNSGQPAISYKPRAAFSKELNAFAEKIIMEREGKEGLAKLGSKGKKKSKFGK